MIPIIVVNEMELDDDVDDVDIDVSEAITDSAFSEIVQALKAESLDLRSVRISLAKADGDFLIKVERDVAMSELSTEILVVTSMFARCSRRRPRFIMLFVSILKACVILTVTVRTPATFAIDSSTIARLDTF